MADCRHAVPHGRLRGIFGLETRWEQTIPIRKIKSQGLSIHREKGLCILLGYMRDNRMVIEECVSGWGWGRADIGLGHLSFPNPSMSPDKSYYIYTDDFPLM